MPDKELEEFDRIKAHCKVNGEDGKKYNEFVGIKVSSDPKKGPTVYFPLGYRLSGSVAGIRADIRHLFQVLSEFPDKKDSELAMNKFDPPEEANFPINAYLEVMHYYMSRNGQYYVEADPVYATRQCGKIHWGKTLKYQKPLVQDNSLIFTQFTVKLSSLNDTKEITQINRFCVYESFRVLGWLYVSYMPEDPGALPNTDASIAFLNDKLAHTFNDRHKRLFRAMRDMLKYMNEKTPDRQNYFGTNKFAYVWEKLIDKMFGVPKEEKKSYFPRTYWILDHAKDKDNSSLMPDSIMRDNEKCYVLDAKYYRYGVTGDPTHLPESASISKQIVYGEYIHEEKKKEVEPENLFNAFIMPYNMKAKKFFIDDTPPKEPPPFKNIGEAFSDWKHGGHNFERIQGIVADTRDIMHGDAGTRERNMKKELAECIEKGFGNEKKTLREEKRKKLMSNSEYYDNTRDECEEEYGVRALIYC